METAVQMIARLREEKKLMLAAILKVEDWARGEGYLITPSTEACFRMMKKLGENPNDAIDHPLPPVNWRALEESQQPRIKRAYRMSPEMKETQRQRMRDYWKRVKAEAAVSQ